MSRKCVSVVLWNCSLPSLTLDHLFQQISACSTLHTIHVRDINLRGIQSLSLQYLPSLTQLCLWNTNLCRFHLLHLTHLMEKQKLPKLRELDIGGNNFNHLQDELDIFLRVLSRNHQIVIRLIIYKCNLPNTFSQKVGKYTEPPSFLHILGENLNRGDGLKRSDIEEHHETISPVVAFLRKTIHSLGPLRNLYFQDNILPRHLCGPILKVLSARGNITVLDLSGNTLGIHGIHLVHSVKTWGPGACLQELDLSHCSLPVEACGPLLSALGRCRSLTELWLPGNTLTGCLQNFLAEHDSRLPFLQELFLSYTKLSAHDLLHLSQLIQAMKIPQLRELDLGANGLRRIEDSLKDLVQALVSHHQKDLKLNLYFNKLSQEFVQISKLQCQNTDIALEFG